jgi:hypothetical protein
MAPFERTTSHVVSTKPGCVPLRDMYEGAVTARPHSWSQIEQAFVRAMEGFDANIASGTADMGDLQNGKGDFFNDLLALILENCAGVDLFSRGSVPGLTFPKHHLDITYPSSGVVEFMVEAKAVGTPKHPGSPKQRPIGRAGSADLDKRVKEIGFKTIDLKAEHARILSAQGVTTSAISGDLTTWLRSVRPRSYVFIAARVINSNDHARVVRFAHLANLVSDSVGLFCFGPPSETMPTAYEPMTVPVDIELDRVLYRACQDLASIASEPPITPTSASPAQTAESLPVDDD